MKIRFAWALLLLLVLDGVAWSQTSSAKQSIRVWLPERSWVVAVDLPGFAVQANETKPDGRRYVFAANDATGVIFSATVEGVKGPATLEECRRHLSQRAQAKDFTKQDIKQSEADGKVLLEYTILEAQGQRVEQRNLFVCIPKDDVYVDLHLSKAGFASGEERLFQPILQSVRFEGLGSMEYFGMGSKFYLQQQYQNAIPPYEKALDLEKKNRALSQTYWRVLVDNLGTSYGLTGQMQKAKGTFEYGVSQDPTYPMFHYNLACAYAELGDLENAKASLRTAFRYKGNMIPGEEMPDPRQDSSFQPLMQKDPQFRRFLDALMKGS